MSVISLDLRDKVPLLGLLAKIKELYEGQLTACTLDIFVLSGRALNSDPQLQLVNTSKGT